MQYLISIEFCYTLESRFVFVYTIIRLFFITVVVLKISIFQVQCRSLLSYTYFMKNDYYYIAYNIIVAILYWNDTNVSIKPLMAKKAPPLSPLSPLPFGDIPVTFRGTQTKPTNAPSNADARLPGPKINSV